MAEEVFEPKTFARFEKRDDFVKLQDSLLALEFVDEVSTEDNRRSDLKLLEDLSKIVSCILYIQMFDAYPVPGYSWTSIKNSHIFSTPSWRTSSHRLQTN